MTETLRIGTRSSALAIWQAELAGSHLKKLGFDTKLVFIQSRGDVDTTTPLTEMGGKGVFTKALDDALLNEEIDIAVHSYKDLPTRYPVPLKIAAILERGDPRDVLISAGRPVFMDDPSADAVIATGSNRRKAQWLHRYPNHDIIPIRGNVQTRLQKVLTGNIDGAIFAAAGIQRLGMDHQISEYLDWMIPAPAQGAIALMVREDASELEGIVTRLNHEVTQICTGVERELLNRMEAGCSAPVGAYAWEEDGVLTLQAAVLATDGSLQYDIEMTVNVDSAEGLGIKAADKLLSQGADRIMELHGNRT